MDPNDRNKVRRQVIALPVDQLFNAQRRSLSLVIIFYLLSEYHRTERHDRASGSIQSKSLERLIKATSPDELNDLIQIIQQVSAFARRDYPDNNSNSNNSGKKNNINTVGNCKNNTKNNEA